MMGVRGGWGEGDRVGLVIGVVSWLLVIGVRVMT